jgi:hypothetical protein
MKTVYLLESYNYDESEVLGVYEHEEHAEAERIRLGHRNCQVRAKILTPNLHQIGTVKAIVSITEYSWDEKNIVTAYVDQPTAYVYGQEPVNVVEYDYTEDNARWRNNEKYITKYWTVTADSAYKAIELLEEAMGDVYTNEIDEILHDEVLSPEEK